MEVDLSRYINRHGDKFSRLVWEVVWRVFAALTPRWMLSGWRRSLLRLFGAKVGRKIRVHGGARVWKPANLTIGDNSWVGDGANLYCVAPIRIGANAVISEDAFICTAEHDISSNRFELKTKAIEIGDMAWIGSRATILPGRKIGVGAVVAANAVVTHDVAPWMVVAGNPARVIRERRIKPMSPMVTFVVPVKNEEKNLDGCLKSLENQEYVIVVDSGSIDRTKEIAATYHREVVDFHWDGHFPKKRNWLLANYQFKTPWVMFIDADERVTDDWVEEMNYRLQSDASVDAYICYYDNFFMGRMLRFGDVMHKTAILRVGSGGYERVEETEWSNLDMEIHEQLVVKGRIAAIRSRLKHYDRRSLEAYLNKHEEYAKWEACRYHALTNEQWAKMTRRQELKYRYVTKRWFAICYFLVSYFLRLGFLDGVAGFWFAWYKMKYFRNVRGKILKAQC